MMDPMFDVDDLVARCQDAIGETEPRRAIREVLERTLARPDEVASALDPEEGGLTLLHNTDDLTVLHVVWAPGMELFPHDHRMWAAIGIYTGQEDNAFYRRTAPDAGTLTESGGRSLTTGDTIVLGTETIHGVANPLRRLTGAIHVYGGDFVRRPRSQWGPGPREERPYDIEVARRQFAEANAAWRSATAGADGDADVVLSGGVGDPPGEPVG
jgi:predicted metal-dependent enzyme (double-stranded beta helix superfamily)